MSNMSSVLEETLRRLPIDNVRLQNLLLEKYRACFPGSGVEFSELRTYVPGDNVHDIDWRASARLHQTYVKTFIETFDNNVLFAIDTSSSMNSIDVNTNPKVQSMLAATFLLARTALRNGDRVGFFYRMHDNYIFRPFSHNKSVLYPELSRISQVIDYSYFNEQDWDEFLEKLNTRIKQTCICFVISDNLDFRLSTISKLKVASLKHKLLFIELTNWFDFLSPGQEDLVVTDIETGETFDWFLDNQKLIESVQKEEKLKNEQSPIVLKIPARYTKISELSTVIYDIMKMLSGRRTVLTRHILPDNERA